MDPIHASLGELGNQEAERLQILEKSQLLQSGYRSTIILFLVPFPLS